MATALLRPRILVTGLTMPASKLLAPQMDTTAFSTKLDASIATITSLPNFEVTRFDMDHSAAPDSPESIEAFARHLRQQQPYDAHILGAGLRRIPELIPLLERILDEIVRRSVSGEKGARVLLSENGFDHRVVLRRGFPELVPALD